MQYENSPINEQKRLESKLTEIIQEASVKNWDGYNATPIKKESISAIRHFIKIKISDIPNGANIVPNPDGTVCLEWEDIDKKLLISFDKQEIVLFSYVSDHESFFCSTKFEWHDNLTYILKRFK